MRGKQKSSPRQFALRLFPLILLLVFSLLPLSSWGFQSQGGHSVVSGNADAAYGQTTFSSIDDEEVTPETWRTINLEMHKADGSVAKIDLLRPLWWLEEAKAEIGGTIPLSMQEMGIEGDAKVLNIGPCKTDSRTGDPRYRVVTGKFTHENAIVLDLYFNNNPNEPLGVTPNHPLWSEIRNGWVEAGQLKVGEYVKTKDGIAQLTQRRQRPGRHKVYNLEVHKDHTYYVSNLGILAHNNCAKKNPLDGTEFTPKVQKQMQGNDLDHNFPSLVDQQADAANVRTITGGDGVQRTKVELPGSINGKDGNYSWIIEPDGKTINHRQFERSKN